MFTVIDDTFTFKVYAGSVVIVPAMLTHTVLRQLILGATLRGLYRTAFSETACNPGVGV